VTPLLIIYLNFKNFSGTSNDRRMKKNPGSIKAKWNFPNCCGAIDGKHCQIKRPDNCLEFYNYKGTYSIILFALVDADYRSVFTDVGSNGRVNDGAVFRNSTLYSAVENNLLNWPDNSVRIGDDAFPLRNTLLKPYSKVNLNLKQGEFLKMRLVFWRNDFAFSVNQLN
jgi:hypothetical protein